MYNYLKHLIQLWPGDWVKQMEKRMNRLAIRIFLIILGEINSSSFILQVSSSGNLLGVFYWKFPIGLEETIFGEQLKICQ